MLNPRKPQTFTQSKYTRALYGMRTLRQQVILWGKKFIQLENGDFQFLPSTVCVELYHL